MKKRLIATWLLASLACWNVPVTLAMPAASQKTSQQASEAQDHSCCPRFHMQLAARFFVVIPPAQMPCDDQHPCCAKPGPENPPALTAVTRVERPKAHVAVASATPQNLQTECGVVRRSFPTKFLASYSVRSTVLRI
jgi:hypothetical protein